MKIGGADVFSTENNENFFVSIEPSIGYHLLKLKIKRQNYVSYTQILNVNIVQSRKCKRKKKPINILRL